MLASFLLHMAYTPKPFPAQDPNEPDRDYVRRLMEFSPNRYSAIIDRLPHILNQIEAMPFASRGERTFNWLSPNPRTTCLHCASRTEFVSISAGGYREFCSCSCRAKQMKSNQNGLTSEAVKKREMWRAQLNPTESTAIVARAIATKIDRYGPDFMSAVNRASQQLFADRRDSAIKDREWLYEQHITLKKPITHICDQYGLEWNSVRRALQRHNIEVVMYHQPSLMESQVVQFMRTAGIDCQQHNRDILAPKELDIVVSDQMLAIEVCGLYWHSTANPRMGHGYHASKFAGAAEKGYKLITLFEDEWVDKPEIVKSRLRSLCGKSQHKIYARQTTAIELDAATSRLFMDANHIQGDRSAPIRYGLVHRGELVSVMTFGKPRYDSSAEYEMIRFASKLNTSVIGAGSKLFSKFLKDHAPNVVISYADNRWGTGQVYTNLGFSDPTITPPSYWYFKPGTLTRYHRSTFMKHKIIEMGGDPNLTESENMEEMGYCRIWDCGTTKWTWKKDA